MLDICSQALLLLGTDCWVLNPGQGRKPVGEGIAGSAPPTVDTERGKEPSYLLSLCEAGQQYVTLTKVRRKGGELMFDHANPYIRNLDEALAAPVLCDRTVRWSTRYLVEKASATRA